MEDIVERVTPGTESWARYGTEHLQRYQHFAELYAGKTVLDAACGTGYGTHLIAATGAKEARGVDISKEAIDYCHAHFTAENLFFEIKDLANLRSLKQRYDLVVSFETIEHLNDPHAFVKQVASILLPGGRFICSTPNPARHSEAGGHNPFHVRELSWNEFHQLFARYFDNVEAYHQSETIEYLRYMELRHMLHQQNARINSYILNRIENFLRRLSGRPFRSIPFYHSELDVVQPQEIRIEKISSPAPWHKTFIFSGTVKKQ